MTNADNSSNRPFRVQLPRAALRVYTSPLYAAGYYLVPLAIVLALAYWGVDPGHVPTLVGGVVLLLVSVTVLRVFPMAVARLWPVRPRTLLSMEGGELVLSLEDTVEVYVGDLRDIRYSRILPWITDWTRITLVRKDGTAQALDTRIVAPRLLKGLERVRGQLPRDPVDHVEQP